MADEPPMVALGGVGFGVFFLVSLAVGLRLLALATRTHRSPELLIGIGILGIGPTGLGCMLGAAALYQLSPSASRVFTAAALVAVASGSIASCLFNRMVFRAESAGARAWVHAMTALFGVAFGVEIATTRFADPLHPGAGASLVSLLCTLNLLWGAAESIRYWRLMRRRLRLGLADPLVTNRFLLWGLGIGAAGVGSLISLGVQQVVGLSMAELPVLTFSNSLFGLASALLMWVAFLPPAAWRRWVQRRAEAR